MGDSEMASRSATGLRRRGVAAEPEYEPLENEEIPEDDMDENKYRKFRSQKQRESERKAKIVMYITLVMWILMIVFMFYKIGEGLYMAYLHKHGILHTYTPRT